ncbi:MAG: MFS transporter [Thaumarchaeota archaeon]|jgi:MFS family permease|nr:MFS transporter [Nitrososphaerota archaeon]
MSLKQWKNRNFEGVLLGGLVHQSASSMQGAIAAPFFNSRGVSPGQIGMLNSISWSIISFSSMPLGRLSDFTGRRTPLMLSSLLGAIACILVFLKTNIFTALSLYVLIGFSTALFTPNANALIFENTEPSKAPLFFAVFYLATLTGSSVSSLLAGWLSKFFAPELPFFTASTLFLLSIPIYYLYVSRGRRTTGNRLDVLTRSVDIKTTLQMLRRNQRLVFYGFSIFFHELGFFVISPYISLFAQKVVGLDMAGVGMIIAIWNIGLAVGFLPWAWVTTRKGSWRMMLTHLAISSPAWILLALSDNFASMGFYIFIFGITGAMDLPARRTLTAEICQGENLGEAMGFIELSNGLGGVFGGIAGGLLWERFGPASIFYAASVLTLFSTALFLMMRRTV